MKRIAVITPVDAPYGFSISRATQYITTPDEAEALLLQILADPATGVVIIDERLLAKIEEERLRELERRWFGVLVVLPSPGKPGGPEEEDYALRMIRRAIGYHVRLQR